MPYITPEAQQQFVGATRPVIQNPGTLNFYITQVLDDYLRINGLTYTNINATIGVLECAKLELYRRVAVPYEDTKCRDNGDVYSEDNLGEV
jgi:hypothetical protein|tara:strand:+ start:326 stop:598 length:273 start_codon:yes stop_codon:yes gene_type:complete